MSDLISRKALIEWLTSHFDLELDEPLEKEMIRLINDQDTIQPQGIDKDRLIEELETIKYDTPYNSDSELGWNLAVNNTVRIIKNQSTVNQQPTSDGWIPVSRGYPTEEGWYWVTDNFDCITTELIRFMPKVHGTFEEFMDFFDHKVIAWMPAILPQPYKESE